MTDIKDFFEAAYSENERYWWKVPYAYSINPDDLASSLLGQAALRWALARRPGRVIDVGSGEGADAIRFARLGWEVDALELTAAGCEKIEERASSLGVRLTVQQADICSYTPSNEYDLVICNGVLHYIEDKSAVCQKLQSMTVPGGANVVSLWSTYTPVPEPHKILPVHPDPERGAVYTAYAGWAKDLLYFERERAEKGHDDMGPHVHSFIKMLAIRGEAV